jgi:hypothetical protein
MILDLIVLGLGSAYSSEQSKWVARKPATGANSRRPLMARQLHLGTDLVTLIKRVPDHSHFAATRI